MRAKVPVPEDSRPLDDELGRLRALHAIASHVNASSDEAETLRHTLQAFCRETRWAGAVIMKADTRSGVVEVLARHDPAGLGPGSERLWPLSESPVQRVLATASPVILPDAQVASGYPGYRQQALERGYRTVVLLPMTAETTEGCGTVLAASSREVETVSERDIAFLELVVHLGSIAIEKARSLREEQAFAKRLNAVMAGNAALLDRVLTDGSTSAVTALVAEVIRDPFVVVDLTSRRASFRRSPWPDSVSEEAWAAALEGGARADFLKLAYECAKATGFERREIVTRLGTQTLRRAGTMCPLRVDGSLVGALIVFGDGTEPGALDHLLTEGARLSLSIQMMRAHVKFTTEARGLENLLSGLLQGTMPPAEVRERAERFDLALDRPARLLVLGATDPSVFEARVGVEALRAISEVASRHEHCSAALVGDAAIVVHGAVSPRDEGRWRTLARQALEEFRLATGQAAIAVRSRVCLGIPDYPSAFRECGRVIELGRRFGRTGELSAQDFGPLPVLMSAVDTQEMGDFVRHLIGGMARHDDERGTAYLPTLSSYLDHGCRARACAAALGLHVTTLRYRLARLRDLFGIETDTPEQRFSLQLALRFQDVLTPSSRAGLPPKRRRQSGAVSADP